jgi:hypothetical protein
VNTVPDSKNITAFVQNMSLSGGFIINQHMSLGFTCVPSKPEIILAELDF